MHAAVVESGRRRLQRRAGACRDDQQGLIALDRVGIDERDDEVARRAVAATSNVMFAGLLGSELRAFSRLAVGEPRIPPSCTRFTTKLGVPPTLTLLIVISGRFWFVKAPWNVTV